MQFTFISTAKDTKSLAQIAYRILIRNMRLAISDTQFAIGALWLL